MTGAPFDLRDYRHALGAFLTGVTVVTTLDRQGGPRGFTANSFTSVSLDPPLVLVCIDKRGRSFEVFAEGDGYAVNILSESQQAVSSAFATPTGDRFARVAWHAGPAGHPVFEGAAAWLDCRRHDLVDAGDHVIMIGRVVGYHHTVRPPLGYSRGTYVSASLEREAIARTGYATEIVAILEHDEAILLVGDDDDAPLGLPHAEHIGDTGDTGSLLGLLDAAGFDAELGFVFSVVDNARDRAHPHRLSRDRRSPRGQRCLVPVPLAARHSMAAPLCAGDGHGLAPVRHGTGAAPVRRLRRRCGDGADRLAVVGARAAFE